MITRQTATGCRIPTAEGLSATSDALNRDPAGISAVGLAAAEPLDRRTAAALATGFVSVYWGRAAYETRGLALPIVAHCMVDTVLFSAYFVPRQ